MLVAFTTKTRRKTPSSAIHVLRCSMKDIIKLNLKMVNLTNPRFGRSHNQYIDMFYYHTVRLIQHVIHPLKHYYIIGTNLMQGTNYGTIMICMDKTKTLGDVKRKIVEFLNQNHGVSISENHFELYRINTRPINPGSFSWKNYRPEIGLQSLESRLCNICLLYTSPSPRDRG